MGQDQVSGGVSVLCWLAAPVAISQNYALLFLESKFDTITKVNNFAYLQEINFICILYWAE